MCYTCIQCILPKIDKKNRCRLPPYNKNVVYRAHVRTYQPIVYALTLTNTFPSSKLELFEMSKQDQRAGSFQDFTPPVHQVTTLEDFSFHDPGAINLTSLTISNLQLPKHHKREVHTPALLQLFQHNALVVI